MKVAVIPSRLLYQPRILSFAACCWPMDHTLADNSAEIAQLMLALCFSDGDYPIIDPLKVVYPIAFKGNPNLYAFHLVHVTPLEEYLSPGFAFFDPKLATFYIKFPPGTKIGYTPIPDVLSIDLDIFHSQFCISYNNTLRNHIVFPGFVSLPDFEQRKALHTHTRVFETAFRNDALENRLFKHWYASSSGPAVFGVSNV